MNQKKLKELLHYDPETGVFRWIKAAPNRPVGRVAGWVNAQGYIGICVEGKTHLAHRLAWLYVNGELPADHIDHINHDRGDNRWKNLRVIPEVLNHRNQKLYKGNKSGLPGVFQIKDKLAWKAYIGTYGLGTREYLGQFSDFFEACCARKSAENRHGYHANHGRKA